jgi:DNA-binding NtrC family response regulator
MRSRVVIADSNELLLAVYRSFLVAEGFEAVTVTNGLDCLRAMKEAAPCVLVIDPEILWGGSGVLALMRDEDDIPAVPVLILTMHPETVTERTLPSSRYAVMIKPVAPTTVAGIVRTLAAEGDK